MTGDDRIWAMTTATQLLPAADRVPQVWRNGGGITYPVAAEPPDADAGGAFSWRVSIARIAADGAFSAFPGVDRSITIIDGHDVELLIGDEPVTLRPGVVATFRGETAVSARLTNGPTLDLNLMTARGHTIGTMRIEDVTAEETTVGGFAEVTIVVAIDGQVQLDGFRLNALDAVQLGSTTSLAARGARIAVIEIGRR